MKTVGEEIVTESQSGQLLKTYVERVEKLENDKAEVMEDLRELYKEIKFNGFDTKALRKIVRLRKMEESKRIEEEEIFEFYKSILGMA